MNIHYLAGSATWDAKRWPNFREGEIACRHCGESYIDVPTMDALQMLRKLMGGPITVTCGHRCAAHNKAVGGAARSEHLLLALDIAVGSFDRFALLNNAKAAGFKRFGLMNNALHVDMHPIDAGHAAMWTYGPTSRAAWAGRFPPATPDIGGR